MRTSDWRVTVHRKLADLRRRSFPPRSRREALLQRWAIEPLRLATGRVRRGRLPRSGEPKSRARILFVLQDAGGGVRETHRDLMSVLHRSFECFVVTGSLHRVRLHRWAAARGSLELLRTWWLRRAWSHARYRGGDYRRIYDRIAERLDVDLVHVRHLLGHTLDLFDVCAERSIPLVVSFHDFYMACPSIHLVDDTGTYCGGRCTPSAGQCRLPISWLADLAVLKSGPLERWRREVEAVLPRAAAFITTSEAAREVMSGVYPELRGRIRRIEHGRDFEPVEPVAVEPAAGERVRIVVAGNPGPHKGSGFLRRLLELDRRRDDRLEVHLLGGSVAELEPWVVGHGGYRREDFARLARSIAPSFAGIFSIWPETYSHTLTEAWSVGLPVLASDIGTLRERLRAHGGGWLIPFRDVELSYRRILEIADDLEGYRRQQALAHVCGLPSVEEMGEAYREVYERLLIC